MAIPCAPPAPADSSSWIHEVACGDAEHVCDGQGACVGLAGVVCDAANEHAEEHGAPEGHYYASLAFEAMGRYEEAASAARAAHLAGFRRVDIPARIAYLLEKAERR